MKRMIFHMPLPLNPQAKSASGIRPVKMLEAFKSLGYEVFEITGYSAERKIKIDGFLIKNIERERRKMQITALDHLVLTTSNFELCVWFYRDVLGMELLCQDDHYAFRFGMQKINVHRCPAEFLPAAGNVAYGSLDICLLTVTELPIVYQELAKHGIAVEVGIVERNGALGKMQSLYVRDPDNNLVEISRYE